MSSPSPVRTLAAMIVALGLMFTVTACGEDEADKSSASAEGGSSTSADTEPAAEPESDPESDPAPTIALDHDGALNAGLAHTAAITCEYTYDEQERASLELLSQGAEISEGMTVYLSGDVIYTDIPNPDGRMSHMLTLDGFLYTWKVPSEAKGIKSPDLTEGGDALKQRLVTHTHDCTVYDGPDSIFAPPTDITFVFVE